MSDIKGDIHSLCVVGGGKEGGGGITPRGNSL